MFSTLPSIHGTPPDRLPHRFQGCFALGLAQAQGRRIMLKEIETHRDQIADLCRRYGVKRLELFGSAARGTDFEPGRSDIDFLVDFNDDEPRTLEDFLDLESKLSDLLGRPVDVISRGAVERSRNYIRRRSILRDAQAIYG